MGRTKKYIEVSGRPGPAEFLSPTYSGHLDRYNLTFKIESIPVLEEIKLLYRKLMVSMKYFYRTIFHHDLFLPTHSSFFFLAQMNETYQHPGKWHDQILHPSMQRYDSRTFIMSYIIIALEHNSVYEVMVQAKNMYGWNEVNCLSKKNVAFVFGIFFSTAFFFVQRDTRKRREIMCFGL